MPRSASVVHRDIKPSNLLITPEGQVKLIDMGLARLRETGPAAADLTASGITLGTFDYISPEQARDPRNADVRSDLYSLGCTFFFMLTGRPPFPDGTVLQKLLQHQGDQPPDVRQFRPDLPDGVTRVLRRALAKDPRHRYAEPGEMVDDLLLLAQEAGIRLLRLAGREARSARQLSGGIVRRHLPWAAPLAALLLIVALLDVFGSRPSSQEAPMPASPLAELGDVAAAARRRKANDAGLASPAPAKDAAGHRADAAALAPGGQPLRARQADSGQPPRQP